MGTLAIREEGVNPYGQPEHKIPSVLFFSCPSSSILTLVTVMDSEPSRPKLTFPPDLWTYPTYLPTYLTTDLPTNLPDLPNVQDLKT